MALSRRAILMRSNVRPVGIAAAVVEIKAEQKKGCRGDDWGLRIATQRFAELVSQLSRFHTRASGNMFKIRSSIEQAEPS